MLQLHEVPIIVLHHLFTAVSCRSPSPEGPGPASPLHLPEGLVTLMTNGDLVPPLGTGVGPPLVLDHGQLTLSVMALSQPSPHEHGQITSLVSVCSVLVTTVSFAQLGRIGRYLFPRHVQCLIARTSPSGD